MKENAGEPLERKSTKWKVEVLKSFTWMKFVRDKCKWIHEEAQSTVIETEGEEENVDDFYSLGYLFALLFAICSVVNYRASFHDWQLSRCLHSARLLWAVEEWWKTHLESCWKLWQIEQIICGYLDEWRSLKMQKKMKRILKLCWLSGRRKRGC